jgi:glycosyltransferase involved in cell wall biosynthesis
MLPLVSVRVITYNHEKYIVQCLEGILMQHTEFPFEIVVGEHSSTDRTLEIVQEYQKRFPERVRLLITGREQNAVQNEIRVQQACRGKYQAICEGDDYWIDPLKMQKQVDFLESHPDMTMCFHNALLVDEELAGARIYFPKALPSIFHFKDICLTSIPAASLVARAAILNTLPEWSVTIMNTDRLMRLWCAHHGTVGYLHDIMSIYRLHDGGMIRSMGKSRRDWYKNTVYLCQEFNAATNYQHAVLMKQFLKSARQIRQRADWGRAYYLLHPRQAGARLEALIRAIKGR